MTKFLLTRDEEHGIHGQGLKNDLVYQQQRMIRIGEYVAVLGYRRAEARTRNAYPGFG